MRVIVLGGAGDMGRRAVRELAGDAAVEQVTLADLDLAAARAVRSALGLDPDCVRLAQVDVLREEATAALLAEHDAVVGAVGPFYRFEEPMVRAAIRAGVPYVSLCDDYDAVQAVLALDDQARSAGIPVLTGVGWTPGLSNLLVRHAADAMDALEEVDIAWAGSAADSEGWAVILHTMHIFAGVVPTWRDGAPVQVPAGSEGEVVDFGEGLGRVRVFHTGHPEPVTIPRYIPGVRRVSLKGGLAEGMLNLLAVGLGRIGLTAGHRRRVVLGRVLQPLLPVLARVGPRREPRSGLVVRCRGRIGDRVVRRTYRVIGRMADLTAVPAAAAAVWAAQGRVRRHGVFAPEAPGGLPAGEFLDELARRGIRWEQVEG